MTKKLLRRALVVLVSATAAIGVGAITPLPATAATAMNGTFTIAVGSCIGGVHGSYFRMIMHSGSTSGPFLSNSGSACSKKTYTLLSPGRNGGLITGQYQPQAKPAFDSSGNALTDLITKPTRFYGVNFATATNSVDPQTGKRVTAPHITLTGKTLSGDLRSFAVSWNKQQFNQGSPKPSGTRPGNTRPVTGTYDATTGKYTLQWTSQIQGGPFDGFTGLWHLTGTFKPARSAPAITTAPTAAPSGATSQRAATPARTAPAARSSRPERTAVTTKTVRSSSPAALKAVPSLAPSGGPPSNGTEPAAAGSEGSGSPSGTSRWPWLLAAFGSVGAVAAVATRHLRARRIA